MIKLLKKLFLVFGNFGILAASLASLKKEDISATDWSVLFILAAGS